jgi:hypothetical protein
MFRAPAQTPHISTLLDDMPTRDLRRVARHLGLTAPTLRRYARTGNAPRVVHLALFWESRWGLSVLDCEIVNRERVLRGQADALGRENKALKAQLSRLAALANGAANDPLWSANCERATAPGTMATRQDDQPPQLQLPLLVSM